MELITSKTNARIKDICKLMAEKKYRQEKKLFVLEGMKIINEAAQNNVEIISMLFTQKFLDKNTPAILNNFKYVDKILVTADICKKISNNKSPQEVFAVCKIPQNIIAETNPNKVLLLSNLQDPGNIGTIIRTADALGIKNMILTNDCSDIYNQKVIRATMGSIFRVQISYTNNIFKTIENYKFLGFKSYASALRADSNDLNHVNFSDKILMIIGNEGQGLNQDVIDACDESIIIHMSANVDSLNAAVAASIIMWEMTKEN